MEYEDRFPVTVGTPYIYTEMTAIQRSRLNTYLEYAGLSRDVSAADFMRWLYAHYGLDDEEDFSQRDKRLVAGVRYELEVRFADSAIPAYTSAADADAIVQVGLPSDIDPMINLMVKLGLTELTRGEEDSGIESLGEELRTDNFFIWANRRTQRFIRYNPFNEPENGPTILRWYGCTIPRIPTCGLCSETNR